MELKFFRILKADPLGEPWSANGGTFQTFWCQFAGVEHPVKVNKKAGSTPSLTTGQFGYLLEQTSQKGTKYYQFKGQQVPQGMAIPSYADAAEPSQPAQPAPSQAPVHPSDQKEMPYWFAPYAMKINFIYEEMKGVSDKPMTQQQALDGAKKADESYGNKAYGNETYGDQKISKDELEDIFGGPMSEPVSLEDK